MGDSKDEPKFVSAVPGTPEGDMVVKLKPGLKKGSAHRYAELVNRGEALLRKQRPDIPGAIRLLEQAISVNPAKPGGHMNLAIAHQRSDRYLEASQAFLAAMERFPEGTEKWAIAACMAYDQLCNVVTGHPCKGRDSVWCTCEACAALPPKPEWMGSAQGVLEMANRFLQLDGTSTMFWSMKGEAEDALGNLKEAAQSYMKAASLFKNKNDDSNKEILANRARDVLRRIQLEQMHAELN